MVSVDFSRSGRAGLGGGCVKGRESDCADLLLVLLVDGIHGILDSDALHAPCSDM